MYLSNIAYSSSTDITLFPITVKEKAVFFLSQVLTFTFGKTDHGWTRIHFSSAIQTIHLYLVENSVIQNCQKNLNQVKAQHFYLSILQSPLFLKRACCYYSLFRDQRSQHLSACKARLHYHDIRYKVTSSTHGITEYPELEGTLRDHPVQLLASHSTTQKSIPVSEFQQPWCCVHCPGDPIPVPLITERTGSIVLYFTLDQWH